MIPRKIAMFVPLVLMAACASGPGSDKSLAGKCSSGNLKFHIGDSYMWVTPRNFCVDPGETYTATIQEHGGFSAVGNAVRITSATGWLNNKENSPKALGNSLYRARWGA